MKEKGKEMGAWERGKAKLERCEKQSICATHIILIKFTLLTAVRGSLHQLLHFFLNV